MMDVKKAKAKLYNLKSSIEGLIQIVDTGVIEPDKVPDAVAAMAAKMVADNSD